MKKKPPLSKNKASLTIAAVAFAAALSSCSNSSHLVLYQHSNLGLNTGINPGSQNIHVRIGMRREFAAVVPKYNDKSTDPKGKLQAASAFFGSRTRVSSPWSVPEVAEIMATGDAAVLAASSGSGLKFASESATTEN